MIELIYHISKAKDPIISSQIKQAEKLVEQYQNKIEKDLCISIGGDGTHLRLANEHKDKELLFIRTNRTKSVGYLSDNSIDQLENCLEQIASGSYTVEERPLMSVEVNNEFVGNALQDIWIERNSTTIEFDLLVKNNGNNIWEDSTKLDVLIIYSQYGSSAYNYSVGGPLLLTKEYVLGITYVAPSRELVGSKGVFSMEDNNHIQLKLSGHKENAGNLVFDNGKKIPVINGDEIKIYKSENANKVIRINPESMFDKQIRKREIDLVSFLAERNKLKDIKERIKLYE
jgi:NAD+ kinase